MFNAVLRLRRDNDYNYNKIKDTFIPQDGEVCLVDTAREGLRAVCGDGKTPFAQLEYMNNVFVKGYYSNEIFYKDDKLTEAYLKQTNLLYIDLLAGGLYYVHENTYIALCGLPTANTEASETVAGIMKLYSTTGNKVDGTMTQKAITDELDDKIEAEVIQSEELLIFTT